MDAVLTHPQLPAILGGEPMFPDGLPLARPRVQDPDAVGREVARILRSGAMTNGAAVRELEDRAAEYLGVARCVAVSSCTAGLMLVLKAAELTGDVVAPVLHVRGHGPRGRVERIGSPFRRRRPGDPHPFAGGGRACGRGPDVGDPGDAPLRHAVRRRRARRRRPAQRHPAVLRRGARVRVAPR